MTGVAVAMAAGTAAYMLSNHNSKSMGGKKIKRNAAKAIKTLGSMLDSVEYMMH